MASSVAVPLNEGI